MYYKHVEDCILLSIIEKETNNVKGEEYSSSTLQSLFKCVIQFVDEMEKVEIY